MGGFAPWSSQVTFLAKLNGLDLWAADFGNTYLEALTGEGEKIYIIAGPKFKELEGLLIILKALYSLCTSGLQWHEKFAEACSYLVSQLMSVIRNC